MDILSAGNDTVYGEWNKTKKNMIVEKFYDSFGFWF